MSCFARSPLRRDSSVEKMKLKRLFKKSRAKRRSTVKWLQEHQHSGRLHSWKPAEPSRAPEVRLTTHSETVWFFYSLTGTFLRFLETFHCKIFLHRHTQTHTHLPTHTHTVLWLLTQSADLCSSHWLLLLELQFLFIFNSGGCISSFLSLSADVQTVFFLLWWTEMEEAEKTFLDLMHSSPECSEKLFSFLLFLFYCALQ